MTTVRSRDEATSALPRMGPRDRARPSRPIRELETVPALESVATAELTSGSSRLRGLLFGQDLVAATVGFALTLGLPVLLDGASGAALTALLVTIVTAIGVAMLAIASQGLYRSRTCAVRAVETVRLGRAVAVATGVALLAAHAMDLSIGLGAAVAAVAVTWFLLSASRGLYGAWLRKLRVQGRFCRHVVVVGTGDEGHELFKLVEQHPELGIRVSGVVGPRHSLAQWDGEVEWLGEVTDADIAVQAAGANGVIIAVSDINADELNQLTRGLLRDGVHVQLSSGLRGIAGRRLRSVPLAHEPLFYLEPVSLSLWQLRVKRALDLVIASIILLVSLPVLAVAAIAVKLGDGGSVLFRQTRVGQDGAPFSLMKLRTMVPDAEERLVDLTFANEREGGPLFKLTQDPRRTRVGRFLERTSLDELPQLINVLRGDMSLVGPRPALPHEVAQFDEELLGRQRVLPGITGLWQVEGRENPMFDVYRRLDLFYVENWSVGFDLAILMATFQSVLTRLLWRSASPELSVTPEIAGGATVTQSP
jgi:exopolysaccharide biosynthesis polyprenyl glycosylphosphotransferase